MKTSIRVKKIFMILFFNSINIGLALLTSIATKEIKNNLLFVLFILLCVLAVVLNSRNFYFFYKDLEKNI